MTREIPIFINVKCVSVLDSVIRSVSVIYDGYAGDATHVRVIATSDDTSKDVQLTDAVLAHGSLTLSSDKGTINADDTDTATVTCNDAIISGDSHIDYEVRDSDGEIDFYGSVAVIGGVATYEFTTPIADTYQIRIKRQGAADYEDGYIEVTAQ